MSRLALVITVSRAQHEGLPRLNDLALRSGVSRTASLSPNLFLVGTNPDLRYLGYAWQICEHTFVVVDLHGRVCRRLRYRELGTVSVLLS